MVRVRSVRAALLLSSAAGVVALTGAAQAQTVVRSGPGDVTYTNVGTVNGTPRAISLTTSDGSVAADVATVTSTAVAGDVADVVRASVAGTKALTVKVDTLTGTGGRDLRGISTTAGTGLTTITTGNLNIAGLSGIFADTRGDLVVNAGSITVAGAAVADPTTGGTKDVHGIAAGRLVDTNGNNLRVGGKATITVASVKVTGGEAATAINVDAIGDVSVTSGAIDSEGEGVNIFSERGNSVVNLNGNVTTGLGAVSIDGVNATVNVAQGVTVRSGTGAIEAEGSTGNILIDSKGSVISTGLGNDDSQGAILAEGSGAITIRSNYAESNDANERGLTYNAAGMPNGAEQRGTIMTRAEGGATSITTVKTVANGLGMRGIDAQSTTGNITIVANETTTAGETRNVIVPANPPQQPQPTVYPQSANGINAMTATGTISITSEKVTTTGQNNIGIFGVATGAGNVVIDSGTVTKTGIGQGVAATSIGGTVNVISDNISITAENGGSTGIVASGNRGAKVNSGIINVTNGLGISAVSSGTNSAGVELIADVVNVGTGSANGNIVAGNATSGNTLIDVNSVTATTTGTAATSAIFGRAVAGSVTIISDNVKNNSTQALNGNGAIGSGISGVARGGVNITAGNVEAQGWAIRAATNEGTAIPLNNGKVSITTTGAVTSRLTNAISITGNVASFDVTVEKDSVVTGHGSAALAGGARLGDIVVNNKGKVIGAEGSEGAIGVTATGGGNVTITSNEASVASTTAITSGFISGAIGGVSQSGNGNVSVTSEKATASGVARYGIYTSAAGTGTVTVNAGTTSIDAANIAAISANSVGGAINVTSKTVTNSGLGSVGISAVSTGGANISITSGSITNTATGVGSNTAEGIYADTTGAVTIRSGSIDVAGQNASAIAVLARKTIDVKSEAITTRGNATTALYASTAAGDVLIDSGSLTNLGNNAGAIFGLTNAGTVNAISRALVANGDNSYGLNLTGTTGVTVNSGTVSATGANGYGISATTTAGNANVTSGAIAAGRFGVAAQSSQGDVSIALNGNVTAGTNFVAGASQTGFAVRGIGGNVAITQAAGTTVTSLDTAIEATARNAATIISAGTVTSTGTRSTILATANGSKATVNANVVSNTGSANAITATGTAGVDIVAETVSTGPNAVANDLIRGIAATAGNVTVDVGTVTGNSNFSAIYGQANNGAVSIIADNVTNGSTAPQTVNGVTNPTTGSGVSATGRGVTIVAGNVDANGWAVRASTSLGQGANAAIPLNDGHVSITTTGAVTSRNANAISINGNAHSFDLTVEANSVVAGHGSSAIAGGARVGDIVVNNKGKVFGEAGSDGAIGVTATGGGNVTVTSNETAVRATGPVTGTFASGAIGAVSLGGNGNVSVTSTKASVTGAGRYGIYTSTAGTGALSVTSGTLDVTSDQSAIRAITDAGAITIASTMLTSSSIGIDAVSTTGAIGVTTGTITTTGNAVMAETGGAATVTVNGAVTSNGGIGVRAAGANASVTVNAGASVRGANAGVVMAGVTGNVLTNNGTISSVNGPAVAFTGGAGQFINAGTITAGTGPNVIPAVAFGAGNDTMTLRTGSVINGIVAMGAGNDTVVLSGTSNTATTTQTMAQFTGAETLLVDTGYWTVNRPAGTFGLLRINAGAAIQVNDGGIPMDVGSVVNNGRVLINGTSAIDLNGAQISGSGSLSLIGTGTAVLSNATGLTYTGGTSVTAGKLQLTGSFGGDITTSGTGVFHLGNGGTTGTYTGNLVNNGTFIYDRSDSYTLAGNFSGTGSLVKNGAGVVTFGGTYGFTGTTTINGGSVKFTGQLTPNTELDVRSGTVDLSGVSGGKQTVAELQGTSGGGVALGSSQLVIDQASNTSFAGNITGTGGIVKDGAGTLDLTGTSSYTGQTRVDEGVLKVNGSISGSTVVVNPGATLGGNGTVGGIQAAGGTLSPGNSIGRLTVNGNIVLTAASTYTVEANAAGQADRVDATGTAALGGARLQVLAEAGRYRGLTSYTILTAAGGVSGQFGTVTSNFAFLTPSVTYASNTVTLNLRRNDASFASFAQGTTQLGVANAIASLGGGNAVFEETLLLQDNRVSATFASLSGELHGGIASGMVENAEALRRTLLTQTGGADEGGFGWASFTGNWGKADATTQNARMKTRQSGLLGGVGFAGNGFKSVVGVGSTTASFDAAGHADADSKLVLATAGYQGGGFSATIGGSYAWHDIDTRRSATLGTIGGSLTDAFKGRTGQIFGEVGYGLSTGAYQLTPFIGLSHVQTKTDAVTEAGSALALTIAEDTRDVSFVDAGVRLSGLTGWELGEGSSIAPFASAAWRRAWGDRNGALSARFGGGGAAFAVLGPVVAKDAAELGLGLELRTGPVRFSAGYNGSLASGWTNHSAQMKVSIGF